MIAATSAEYSQQSHDYQSWLQSIWVIQAYTPEHRRAVLKGLRILARVAIRSYMEEQAAASPRAEAGEDGGEGVD